MEWLGNNGVPFSIIFTKTDKLGKNKLIDNIRNYKEKLMEVWEELPPIFLTSSFSITGRDEVLDYIASIIDDLKKQ
jgi:GTP-binding protein